MPVRIYYIRHGETEWSLNGRHTGVTDVPLTTHGEEEARRLGARLSVETFARVFSSPRTRARRTCELAGLGAAMELDAELAEWNYGRYEGRRTSEIREMRPGWNIYRDGCLGGESPADIAARADRVIARLRTVDGNIAVFSHGHFGRVFATRWIGWDITLAEHLALGTTSLSILEWDVVTARSGLIALWNAEVALLDRGGNSAPAGPR